MVAERSTPVVSMMPWSSANAFLQILLRLTGCVTGAGQPQVFEQIFGAALKAHLVGHDQIEVAVELERNLASDVHEHIEQKRLGVVVQ